MGIALRVGFKAAEDSLELVLVLLRAVFFFPLLFELFFQHVDFFGAAHGSCNSLKDNQTKTQPNFSNCYYYTADGNCFSLLLLTNHGTAVQTFPDSVLEQKATG